MTQKASTIVATVTVRNTMLLVVVKLALINSAVRESSLKLAASTIRMHPPMIND